MDQYRDGGVSNASPDAGLLNKTSRCTNDYPACESSVALLKDSIERNVAGTQCRSHCAPLYEAGVTCLPSGDECGGTLESGLDLHQRIREYLMRDWPDLIRDHDPPEVYRDANPYLDTCSCRIYN
ncbi:MAG: hypothetical protein ACOZIN_18460 [Myxococcota bacterium]